MSQDGGWSVVLEEGWPQDGLPWRLALEVDPRRREVMVGPRMPGTGGLDVQTGARARSFFDRGESPLAETGAWLAGDEARELLETLEAGFRCESLWSGDLVASWSDEAWEAGRALYDGVDARLGAR